MGNSTRQSIHGQSAKRMQTISNGCWAPRSRLSSARRTLPPPTSRDCASGMPGVLPAPADPARGLRTWRWYADGGIISPDHDRRHHRQEPRHRLRHSTALRHPRLEYGRWATRIDGRTVLPRHEPRAAARIADHQRTGRAGRRARPHMAFDDERRAFDETICRSRNIRYVLL